MSVRRWPFLLVAIAVGVVACSGSPGGPTTGASVEAAATGPIETGSPGSAIPTPAPTTPTTVSDTAGDTVADTTGSSTAPPTTVDPAGSLAGTDGQTTDTPPSPTTSSPTSASPAPTAGATAGTDPPIVLRLRLDRRVGDAATEGFASFVQAVLTDPRGWTRAGFRFVFDDADYDYTVVLAEGAEVDALCLPYDTFGRFSCQIGPTVALNADRWRTAVDSWPASLDEYRTMLVNHEVGHLLGQHHPASRCPGDGLPAREATPAGGGRARAASAPRPGAGRERP